ncbi:MAG: ubiquitin-conjugating enzyme E2 [Planctomycetota bacterium]|jgi:ubiquitin-protein ligase
MNVRLKRLQSDYEAVKRLARLHPRIEVEGVSGSPPERYRLLLQVRSLRERAGGVVVAKSHRLEVTLPRGYPRDAPLCRMLTPVFHPNIAPHAVCIGDHWSAAEALDLMIQRVGEMLAFQSYNVKSPLNGRAAQWVEQHADRIPLEKEEFFVDLSRAPEAVEPETGTRCANCGTAGEALQPCGKGHDVCSDCSARCETCGGVLCLACGTVRCPDCHGARRAAAPAAAVTDCANCGAPGSRTPTCSRGHWLCADCAVTCETCGRALCMVCGEYPCDDCRTRNRADTLRSRHT